MNQRSTEQIDGRCISCVADSYILSLELIADRISLTKVMRVLARIIAASLVNIGHGPVNIFGSETSVNKLQNSALGGAFYCCKFKVKLFANNWSE